VAGRYQNIEYGPGVVAGAILLADPQRLEQALVNLLDNAALAGSRVLVDFAQAEENPAIIVADDGPGIPEEIRGRLFTPFVSRSPGGTGLGLAIVARVMAAHGGTVKLAGRPGWTTCFVLEFPA
jgi:signal transduction histidine kinase